MSEISSRLWYPLCSHDKLRALITVYVYSCNHFGTYLLSLKRSSDNAEIRGIRSIAGSFQLWRGGGNWHSWLCVQRKHWGCAHLKDVYINRRHMWRIMSRLTHELRPSTVIATIRHKNWGLGQYSWFLFFHVWSFYVSRKLSTVNAGPFKPAAFHEKCSFIRNRKGAYFFMQIFPRWSMKNRYYESLLPYLELRALVFRFAWFVWRMLSWKQAYSIPTEIGGTGRSYNGLQYNGLSAWTLISVCFEVLVK